MLSVIVLLKGIHQSFSNQIFRERMLADSVCNQKQECNELLSEELMVPDDYELCLKHEVGDFDAIPEKVLKDLRDFAANTFMPAVFEYLGDTYPKYRRYSVYYVQREGFFPPSGAFTKEQEYDLNEATDLLHIPHFVSDIIDGKRAVGSAIRICKAINKPELADEFYQIVQKCFIPDEFQDPKDSNRAAYGLFVEPSTGGIQCSCCEEE